MLTVVKDLLKLHFHPFAPQGSGSSGLGRRRKVSDAATKVGDPLGVGDDGGGGQIPDDGVQAVRRGQDGKDGHGK